MEIIKTRISDLILIKPKIYEDKEDILWNLIRKIYE